MREVLQSAFDRKLGGASAASVYPSDTIVTATRISVLTCMQDSRGAAEPLQRMRVWDCTEAFFSRPPRVIAECDLQLRADALSHPVAALDINA